MAPNVPKLQGGSDKASGSQGLWNKFDHLGLFNVHRKHRSRALLFSAPLGMQPPRLAIETATSVISARRRSPLAAAVCEESGDLIKDGANQVGDIKFCRFHRCVINACHRTYAYTSSRLPGRKHLNLQ